MDRYGAETVPMECVDASVNPNACAYLSSALDTMQTYALMRDSVDWGLVRRAAFERARIAENIREVYPAIEEAVRSLGDNHSFFLPSDEVPNAESGRANKMPSGSIFDDRQVDGSLAQIVLPPFVLMDEASGAKYADTAQDIIWQLRHDEPCGWIVDIRWNTGGNMWPMLAGIGPLLGGVTWVP